MQRKTYLAIELSRTGAGTCYITARRLTERFQEQSGPWGTMAISLHCLLENKLSFSHVLYRLSFWQLDWIVDYEEGGAYFLLLLRLVLIPRETLLFLYTSIIDRVLHCKLRLDNIFILGYEPLAFRWLPNNFLNWYFWGVFSMKIWVPSRTLYN